MSASNGNGGEAEQLPETHNWEFHRRALSEILVRLERVEDRQGLTEHLARACADNTLKLLNRSDPLSWVRRSVILGVSSALGSFLAAAIVHTIWLAYFRH